MRSRTGRRHGDRHVPPRLGERVRRPDRISLAYMIVFYL